MENKATIKHSKSRFAISLVAFAASISAEIGLFIYYLVEHPTQIIINLSLLGLSLLSVFLLILSSIFFKRRAQLLFEKKMTAETFDCEGLVYTESRLIERIDKIIKKEKKARGFLASVGVRNYAGETFGEYAYDEAKEVDGIIYRSIQKLCDGKSEYLFGFNLADDFLIYKSEGNPAEFYSELSSLGEVILEEFSKKPNLPNMQLLMGSYSLREGDDAKLAIKRACFAEAYNSTNRLSNDIAVWSPEMEEGGANKRDLANELQQAIDEGQLEVYYQPKFNLKTKRFYGCEALLRWNHPVRGVLPPSLFIPFAERNGRITDIDRYVFRHVCADIAKWSKEKKRLLKVSVNLSRRTIYDQTAIPFFTSTLEEFKVSPLLIDIELTESVASKDIIFTAAIIKKLKNLNFDTSIDDFGVGYSSFNALKRIPFDTLKIDKSFIDDIEIEQKSRDLVGCIIDLGHALGMSIIAEGVQSDKQVQILKKLGLDCIQGFYYSQPLTTYDYERFLLANRFEKEKKK